MTFEKIIQTIIGDTNDERAEGFLRFLSSKLWGLYNDYLMDKIKVAESEIVWNLNMPNAKENQIYNQTVEMPKVSSAQLPEVEILLDDVVGLEQDIHGLQLMVAPDKHSFAITGHLLLSISAKMVLQHYRHLNLLLNIISREWKCLRNVPYWNARCSLLSTKTRENYGETFLLIGKI